MTKNDKTSSMSLQRRPKRSKKQISENNKIERDNEVSGMTHKVMVRERGITERTLSSYESRIEHMKLCYNEFCKKELDAPVPIYAEDDWWRFFRSETARDREVKPMSGKTAEGYLDALIFFQQGSRFGLHWQQVPWAHNPEIRKTIKLDDFNNKELKTTRGAVNGEMTEEFISWTSLPGNERFSNLKHIARVNHYAGLRKGELIAMKVGDEIRFEDGCLKVLLRKDKTANAKNGRSELHYKELTEKGRYAIQFAREGKTRGDSLFPVGEASVRLYNEAIKLAAVELKWPAGGIVYDGLHTGRHGFAQDLETHERAGWKSKSTFRHYARANSERASRV